ncbi:uncharacterized protein MELLADRAFT_106659 [Melampsora larici-populina 98AG31]|uniref:Uncharacterized protein n=1 Tax=Melampsora larici-populina (strain 98AG31 / pathotype 3-4-7) TaxID=747676 RepID=F4RM79_MELLP|nr:uncharacterized protein MELLADRAFT_106659 [Melampsora larici-populina 98AG31]EGG06514.1 hypothetical protein MELLADRAFT_106659 [Melampsora larici-populina 98AG31]
MTAMGQISKPASRIKQADVFMDEGKIDNRPRSPHRKLNSRQQDQPNRSNSKNYHDYRTLRSSRDRRRGSWGQFVAGGSVNSSRDRYIPRTYRSTVILSSRQMYKSNLSSALLQYIVTRPNRDQFQDV